MSFRSEFVDKLNLRYADDVLRHKSIVAEWSRIRAYFRAFVEDISDVKDFALAKYDETDAELSLMVEGHELLFRKDNEKIEIFVDAKHIDSFLPTLEGRCLNFKEEELMGMVDKYMELAFYNALREL